MSLDATGPSSLEGTSTARSISRRWPICTMAGSLLSEPVKKCAIVSMGFCVAESQMRAALVVGYRVNFVNDDGFDSFKDFVALCRGEKDVERFRRGDQDVRRPGEHSAALVSEGVAGAYRGADFGHEQAALSRELEDFAERRLEVFLNVIAQGFERRDVEHFRAVGEVSG